MRHQNFHSRWLWIAILVWLASAGLIKLLWSTGISLWGLWVMLTLSTIFLVQGLFEVPANPSHIGLIMRWGSKFWREKPTWDNPDNKVPVLAGDGLNWVPFRGLFFKVQTINTSKQEKDYPAVVLTTPDNATTEVPIGIAWSVDDGDYVINFINLGDLTGKSGRTPYTVLEDMFQNIINDELRTWARTPNQKPNTWQELQSSGDELVKRLAEKIYGKTIPDNEVSLIRVGAAKIPIPQFGIFLTRISLGEMISFGPVYDATIKKNVEEAQRISETYETDTDIARAKMILEAAKAAQEPMTFNDAYKMAIEYRLRAQGIEQFSIESVARMFSKGWGGKS